MGENAIRHNKNKFKKSAPLRQLPSPISGGAGGGPKDLPYGFYTLYFIIYTLHSSRRLHTKTGGFIEDFH